MSVRFNLPDSNPVDVSAEDPLPVALPPGSLLTIEALLDRCAIALEAIERHMEAMTDVDLSEEKR